MIGEFAIALAIMIFLTSFLLSPVYTYAKNESDDNRLKDQTIRTEGSKTVKINLNSQDEENKSLKFYIVKFPSNGRLSGIVPNITYTPNLGYHGVDNLTYGISNGMSNGTVESSVATITIEVNPMFLSYVVIIIALPAIFTVLYFVLIWRYNATYSGLKFEDKNGWLPPHGPAQDKSDYTSKIWQASGEDLMRKSESDDNAKEILKKEYDRYSDLFKENESLGERRVSFYITLITTIISALGITTVATNLLSGRQVSTGNIFLPIVFFILTGLFLFGLVTHRRIIGRNVTTDNYLVDLDKIRIGMSGIRPPKPVSSRRRPLKCMIFSVGKGGIAETIRVINSLIVGLICAVLWIYILGLNLFTAIPFTIGLVGSWINQCQYARMSYLDEEKGLIRVRKKEQQKEDNKQDMKIEYKKKYQHNNMRETEASIVICSDSAKRLAAQIARLDSIADYPLVKMGSKKIVDTYFDTNQKVLAKKRVALRVREIDGDYWIAVKGPTADGISNIDRSEYEVNWSHHNITKIVDYLKKTANVEGLKVVKTNTGLVETEPLKFLQAIGLVIVQRRENLRKIRYILSKNSSNQNDRVLAELDIDHVIYHFNFGNVSLYDIEIEEKVTEQEARKDKDIFSNSILDEIVGELISKYGPETFRKWKFGKLALGKGIEKLQKDNALKDMVDNNNNLRREAYDKIEEYIQHEEV
jgi:uncharacterized protein YjbK/uncharacterized membrane protein YhiD involved in acid resistance